MKLSKINILTTLCLHSSSSRIYFSTYLPRIWTHFLCRFTCMLYPWMEDIHETTLASSSVPMLNHYVLSRIGPKLDEARCHFLFCGHIRYDFRDRHPADGHFVQNCIQFWKKILNRSGTGRWIGANVTQALGDTNSPGWLPLNSIQRINNF